MVDTDLTESFLFRSEMWGTDMTSAVLRSADLQEVNLAGAMLNGITIDPGSYVNHVGFLPLYLQNRPIMWLSLCCFSQSDLAG